MKFFNEHPFVTLLIVSTVCTAAVNIVRILKDGNTKVEPVISLSIHGNKKFNKEEKADSNDSWAEKDLPKEEEKSKESE